VTGAADYRGCKRGKELTTPESCRTALETYAQACDGQDAHVEVVLIHGHAGCYVSSNNSEGLVDFYYGYFSTYSRLLPENRFAVCQVKHDANEEAVCLRERADDEQTEESKTEKPTETAFLILASIGTLVVLVTAATMLRRLCRWYMRPRPSKQKVNVRLQSIPVTVPEDAVPGEVIAVQVGSRLVNATIPPGAQPSTVFNIVVLVQAQDGVQVIGSPVDGETRVELDTLPEEPEMVIGTPIFDMSAVQQQILQPTADDMEPSTMTGNERESAEVVMQWVMELDEEAPGVTTVHPTMPRTGREIESMARQIDSIAVHRRIESV